MSIQKKIVTIVPHIENIELRKDTGQLPYHLQKILNYDSILVSYYYTLKGGRKAGPVKIPPTDKEEISKDYPYLKTEVPGFKIHFLKNKGRGKFYEKAIYEYIKNNSKKINILNLFHFSAENVFYSLLYKYKNPNGKIYLKLDIDIFYYQSRKYFFNAQNKFASIKIFIFEKLIFPLFFRIVHTISAESKMGINYFKTRFKVSDKKLMILPNGVDQDKIQSYIQHSKKNFEKENIILSVGRIGTYQKNNQLLLDALVTTDLLDWKVYFVGPVEKAFEEKINDFYKSNPQLENKVIFTGNITSSGKLYEYYNRARIFCLTSINEGFPLSACEAAFFGNYLVMSDSIYCFDELTNNGEYGALFSNNSPSGLSAIIQDLIRNELLLEKKCEAMKQYASENLTWQSIVPKLYQRLNA